MDRKLHNKVVLLPRLIRLRDIPVYLGMDRNLFNAEVRSSLTEIPIGEQCISFDRLELDAWIDDYKSQNGRPAQHREKLTWAARELRASSSVQVSVTSTNGSTVGEFARALEQVSLKRPSAISQD